MHEMRVLSLGSEDPLEKEMVTLSSILAWEIPWTEEPGMLQSMGLQKSDTTEWLNGDNRYYPADSPEQWFSTLPGYQNHLGKSSLNYRLLGLT